VIVACDGASRGNPGPAGIGVQITDDDGSVVAEIAHGLGIATNNQAEYTAVLEGLKRAVELGGAEVTVRSDSRLLVEQLSGRFRVKNPTLQRLHKEVRDVASRLGRVRYEHVPRERNTEADRLANEGVDAWLAGGGVGPSTAPRPIPLWGEPEERR
jgi:probable phosphoglycerate mutase